MKRGREPARAIREHTAPINPAGEALAWPMRLNQYEKPVPPCPPLPALSAPPPLSLLFSQRNYSIQYDGASGGWPNAVQTWQKAARTWPKG